MELELHQLALGLSLWPLEPYSALTIPARVAITPGGGYNVTNATLRNTIGTTAGSFVDADATITVTGNLTANWPTVNTLSIIQSASIISGNGSLTKTGAGVLAIASPSTYTGDTIINDGELRLRTSTNRLPTGTNVTINSPGILNLNGSGQNQTIASLSGNGRVGLAGGILTINGTTSTTFSGVIEDIANAGASPSATLGGSITKNGNSTLTLTGANTFSTLLTISSTVGNAVSIGNGGTTGSVTANIATTTNGGLIFNRSDNFNYAGVVSGGGIVTKLGAGTLTMTNAGEWTNTGGVIINGGTLQYGTGGTGLAATVPVTINNGGVLDMNLANDGFGSLVSTAGNTTGELRMGIRTLSLTQTATTARTYSGTITGSGTLTKAGGGWNQTLSGDSNTYSGNIVVSLGRLTVGHASGLGNTTGNTDVASGAEVLFTGAPTNFTINEPFRVAGVGNVTDEGAIAVTSGATPTIAGPVTLSGDATLTVSGSSGVTYSNANAITSESNQNLILAGGPGTGAGGLISGVINLGTGSLTKNQGGTWALSARTFIAAARRLAGAHFWRITPREVRLDRVV